MTPIASAPWSHDRQNKSHLVVKRRQELNPADSQGILINGRLNHFKTGLEAIEGFRMANEKMPSRQQMILQPVKYPLLGILLKVNHDIAQEYNVKLADIGNFANKVGMPEFNALADCRVN